MNERGRGGNGWRFPKKVIKIQNVKKIKSETNELVGRNNFELLVNDEVSTLSSVTSPESIDDNLITNNIVEKTTVITTKTTRTVRFDTIVRCKLPRGRYAHARLKGDNSKYDNILRHERKVDSLHNCDKNTEVFTHNVKNDKKKL